MCRKPTSAPTWQRAIEVHRQLTGERPLGWYTGRTSPNTRRIVAEEGGFLYDADDYSDDLPFWTKVAGKSHLIVPYSLETNDMRFASANMQTGDQFFAYLRDTFDTLYAEGEERPKMMSVGLHCRLAGPAGQARRARALPAHALGHKDVWFCRRIEIARHWRATHPHRGLTCSTICAGTMSISPSPGSGPRWSMRPTISSPTRRG